MPSGLPLNGARQRGSRLGLPRMSCLLLLCLLNLNFSFLRSYFRMSCLTLSQTGLDTPTTNSQDIQCPLCISLWDYLGNVYLSTRERII